MSKTITIDTSDPYRYRVIRQLEDLFDSRESVSYVQIDNTTYSLENRERLQFFIQGLWAMYGLMGGKLRYFFAIRDEEDWQHDDGRTIPYVYFTDEAYFDKKGAVGDCIDWGVLEEAVGPTACDNLEYESEGTFSWRGPESHDEIRQILLARGYFEHPEFTAFVQKGWSND